MGLCRDHRIFKCIFRTARIKFLKLKFSKASFGLCSAFLSPHVGLQTSFRSSSPLVLSLTIFWIQIFISHCFFPKYKELMFMPPYWNEILNAAYKINLREKQPNIACKAARYYLRLQTVFFFTVEIYVAGYLRSMLMKEHTENTLQGE